MPPVGAGAGLAGTVLCLVLFGAVGFSRRNRGRIPARALEVQPPVRPLRHPSAAYPARPIAGVFRGGFGRARIGLLVVSAEDIEGLPEIDGLVELAGTAQEAPARRIAARAAVPASEPGPSLPPANGGSGRAAAGAPPARIEMAPNRGNSIAPVPAAPGRGTVPAAAKKRTAPAEPAGKPARADPDAGAGKADRRKTGPGQNFY